MGVMSTYPERILYCLLCDFIPLVIQAARIACIQESYNLFLGVMQHNGKTNGPINLEM